MTIPNDDFLECPIGSCGSPELLNCPKLSTSFEENHKSISHSNREFYISFIAIILRFMLSF